MHVPVNIRIKVSKLFVIIYLEFLLAVRPTSMSLQCMPALADRTWLYYEKHLVAFVQFSLCIRINPITVNWGRVDRLNQTWVFDLRREKRFFKSKWTHVRTRVCFPFKIRTVPPSVWGVRGAGGGGVGLVTKDLFIEAAPERVASTSCKHTLVKAEFIKWF